MSWPLPTILNLPVKLCGFDYISTRPALHKEVHRFSLDIKSCPFACSIMAPSSLPYMLYMRR